MFRLTTWSSDQRTKDRENSSSGMSPRRHTNVDADCFLCMACLKAQAAWKCRPVRILRNAAIFLSTVTFVGKVKSLCQICMHEDFKRIMIDIKSVLGE